MTEAVIKTIILRGIERTPECARVVTKNGQTALLTREFGRSEPLGGAQFTLLRSPARGWLAYVHPGEMVRIGSGQVKLGELAPGGDPGFGEDVAKVERDGPGRDPALSRRGLGAQVLKSLEGLAQVLSGVDPALVAAQPSLVGQPEAIKTSALARGLNGSAQHEFHPRSRAGFHR